METNQSVEALIKSEDPRAVAESLALCASFRPRLALCAASYRDSGKNGATRIMYAFGGGYAETGGRIFANYLRPASVSELEIAQLTPTEKKEYHGFWVFKDEFFSHGHGRWTSRKTILAHAIKDKKGTLRILYTECPVTGIKGRGLFEVHHVSVTSTLRTGRKADFFIGILHKSANNALKTFNRGRSGRPRPA